MTEQPDRQFHETTSDVHARDTARELLAGDTDPATVRTTTSGRRVGFEVVADPQAADAYREPTLPLLHQQEQAAATPEPSPTKASRRSSSKKAEAAS